MGWKGYSDFLGTGTQPTWKRKYISYEDCKKIAQDNNIKSQEEWSKYTKSNCNINEVPTFPNDVYTNNWEGWDKFLGKEFLSFEDCRNFARTLNLKSKQDWFDWLKLNQKSNDIPSDPGDYFRDRGVWISWGDFLGFNIGQTSRNSEFLSYKEAKEAIKDLNIKNAAEYTKLSREIKAKLKIPGVPQDYYKTRGQWVDWYDYLGKVKKS
jgi:hypothetical protein